MKNFTTYLGLEILNSVKVKMLFFSNIFLFFKNFDAENKVVYTSKKSMTRFFDTLKISSGLISLALVIFFTGSFQSTYAQTVDTYTSSATWTCPAGVTSVQVECWGGGGAGGSAKCFGGMGDYAYGAGGAGGAYAFKTVSVTPGLTYTVNVGASVASGGTASAVNGNPSWFSTTSSVYAEGGAGGAGIVQTSSLGSQGGVNGTGSSSSSIGDTKYAGGSGKSGYYSSSTRSGGGGGSGGTSSAGNSATTNSGATAVTGGGAGGSGLNNTEGVGSNGGAPGGGGGGALSKTTTTLMLGGSGAAGQVKLTYCQSFPATLSINGATAVPYVSYPTITAAIAALNGCGITQATVLELTSNYFSLAPGMAAENTATISLTNVTGQSATNTITIRPASGVTGKTLTSANTTSVFSLNESDYWIIDGRPGGSGSSADLIIENTSTATGGSAIKFSNDATNNIIRYCTLKSNFGSATEGIVNFSTTTGTIGNDSNTITYCIFDGTAGATASPAVAGTAQNGIYSLGTSAKTNSSNTISYCEFKDIFVNGSGTYSSMIFLDGYNDTWTISNNSFYQTYARSNTSSNICWMSVVDIDDGDGHTISSNYFGGNSASCGGTWTQSILSTGRTEFIGINLAAGVGSTTATEIQGNTFKSFNWATPDGLTTWSPVLCASGASKINIGNTTANTIGSQASSSSIVFTKTSTTVNDLKLFNISSTSTVNISNNIFAGISTSNASGVGFKLTAINTDGTAGVFTISSNTIGHSTGTIVLGGGSTAAGICSFYGINNAATGIATITSNTIQNVSVYGTGASLLYGIYNTGSAANSNISSNTISTLSNVSVGTNTSATVTVIYNTATTTTSISSNTIKTITCNNGFFIGIHDNAIAVGTHTISSNIIGKGQTAANDIKIETIQVISNYGIYIQNTGNYTISSNTIQNITESGFNLRKTIIGIYVLAAAVPTITSNTIRKIGSTNTSITSTTTSRVWGIKIESSSSTSYDISKNRIYNLFNKSSYNDATNSTIVGISFYHYNQRLINNFISLNNSDSTTYFTYFTNLCGINIENQGPTGGISTPAQQFYLYYNTVSIAGTVTSGASCEAICFRDQYTTNAVLGTVSNNIFMASTTNAANYVLYKSNGTPSITLDYNYYYNPVASSISGNFAYVAALNTMTSFNVSGNGKGGLNSIYANSSPVTVNVDASVSESDVNTIGFGQDLSSISGCTDDINGVSTFRQYEGGLKGCYEYTCNTPYVGPLTWSIGTSSATFSSVTNAIRALKRCGFSGVITMELKSDYNTSAYSIANETYPITIPSTIGVSSSKYIIIRPASGTTPIISGSYAGPLINLTGAQYIQIDGQPAGTGATKSLTITNTITTTGGSAVTFINSATNNTIRYTNLKSTSPSTTSGVITFSTGTNNSNNTITNCDIDGGAGATADPTAAAQMGIYSSGTANDNIIISNCNIYNNFVRGQDNYGIYALTGSTWTISGNSIYQTNPRTVGAATRYFGIRMQSASSVNNSIYDNYIGGRSASCGGSKFNFDGSFENYFYGIFLNVGTATATSVQNNTIANIQLTSSVNTASANGGTCFFGLYLFGGLVNVGTTTGNTIGSTSANASTAAGASISIIPTHATAATVPAIIGIYWITTAAIDIRNNKVSGFNITNSNITAGSTFYGIYGGASPSGSAAYTYTGNTIGSSTQATNIVLGSSLTTSGIYTFYGLRAMTNTGIATITTNTIQNVNVYGTGASVFYGIHNAAGAATSSISSNTIANIGNLGSGSAASGTTGITNGIYNTATAAITINSNNLNSFTINNGYFIGINHNAAASSAAHSISSNTIGDTDANDISITSTSTTSSIGVWVQSTGTAYTVSTNTIQNITNSGAAAVKISGIQIQSTPTITMTSNTIKNLKASNTAANASEVYGIYGVAGSTLSLNKNIVLYLYNFAAINTANLIGVRFSASSSNTMINNLIKINNTGSTQGLNIYGIKSVSGTLLNLYHNTVVMAGGETSAASNNCNSYCYQSMTANPTTFNVKNNIFINNRTTSSNGHYAILVHANPATAGAIDNNYLEVEVGAKTANIGAPTTNYTLTTWNALSGVGTDVDGSANNVTIDDDGTIDGTEAGQVGTGINLTATVPTDIANTTRATTPTKGCFEFAVPNITATGTLTTFSACSGSNSAEQSFTVSGANLTANLVVTPPTGYEVSTTSGSGFASSISLTPSSGTVASITIYVRTTTSATNGASGNIACTSTSATTQNVATGSAAIGMATIYVNDNSTTGDIYASAAFDGSGVGTIGDPFNTLTSALAAATCPSTTTIYVDAGTYTEENVTISNGTDDIIIQGAGQTVTIFDGDNTDEWITFDAGGTTDNITIADMKVKQYGGTANQDGGAIIHLGGSNIIFEDVIFEANDTYGGTTWGAVAFIENAASIKFDRCIMRSNTSESRGSCIYDASTGTFIMQNCLVYDNDAGSYGDFYHADGGGTHTITNCTFTDNLAQSTGMGASGEVFSIWDGTTTFNNCIFSNNASSYDVAENYANVTLNYCMFDSKTNSSSVANNTVSGTPSFTNTATDDYTLSSSSAALDAGNNTYASGMSYDLAGGTRIYNTTIDLGCYENSSPRLITSGTLSAFSACPNTASSSSSFTVSGSNLSANITITAPTGFEVSSNNSTWSGNAGNITITQSGGSVASTTVYVRMASLSSSPTSANIVCSSTGATSKNVAVSGALSGPSSPNAGTDVSICSGSSTSLSGSVAALTGSGYPASESGTIGNNSGNPFRTYYGNARTQNLYTAAELTAAGLTVGSTINQIALEVTSAGEDRSSLSIGYKFVSSATTALTTTFQTGITNVYSGTLSSTVGVKTYSFSSATSAWNGTDNIVLEYCFSQNVTGATACTIKALATVTNTSVQKYADGGTSQCSVTIGDDRSARRPYISISYSTPITYSWSPSTGLSATNIATPTANPTATTTYTMTATANGCSVTDDVIVTVNSSVGGTATATSPTIGSGTTTTISLSGNSGSTLQWQQSSDNSTWSTVSGGSGGTTATYTTPALSSSTYYRAQVQNGSCTAAYSISALVTISTPTVSTSGTLISFTACSGSNSIEQTFTVSGTNLSANLVVTPPTGFEVSTISGSSFASTVTLTPSSGSVASTTVYVRTTTSATGTPSGNIVCSSTGATSQNVSASGTINALPTISGTASVCMGSTTVLTGSGTAAASNAWASSDATKATINPTTTSGTVTPVAAGSTNITYTDNNGCTSAATSVTINALPTTVTVSTAGTYCTSTTLTAANSASGTIYYQGTTSGGTSIATASTSQLVSATGTYYFRAQSTAGCWGAEGSAAITINTAPSISAQPSTGTQTTCINGTAFTALSVSASGTGLTYQWYSNTSASNSGGTSIGSATSASYTPVNSASGTKYYYCIVSGTSPCTAATSNASGLFTVNALPTISGTASVCMGSTTVLTGSGTAAASNAWASSDATKATINTTTTSGTVTPVAAGSTNITYTDNNGCTSAATSVTINALPTTVTVSTAGTYCTSTTLTAANSASGTIYYQGTTSGGTSIATASTSQLVSATGTYYFRAQSTAGCWGAEGSAAITINTAPSISAQPSTGTQTTCINGTAFTALSVSASGTGLTYQWYSNTSASNSGGTSIGSATSASYTPVNSASGTKYYYCIVSGTSPCTAATSNASGLFTVNASPTITTQTTISETKCPGLSFSPISVTATGTNLTYQWYSNSSASVSAGSIVSGANSASYTPASNMFGTKYYYCVVSSGTCGSSVTSSISGAIVVTPIFSSTIPTTASSTYVWNGKTNDWKTVTNWLYHDNLTGTFVESSTSPSSADNAKSVLIPVNAGCVTHLPTLTSASSTDSTDFKDLIIETGATFTITSSVGVNSGISVHGNFVNNGTFSADASSYVSFEGSTAQTISGNVPTFAKVIVKNSSGVTFSVNATVTGELSLLRGKLNVQGVTLTIGSSTTDGTISGGSSSSYIVAYDDGAPDENVGYVKHYVNADNVSHFYPIGDLTAYAPLTFTLASHSTSLSGAYFTVYTKAVKVPGLNTAFSSYLRRFWEGSQNGMSTGATYEVSYVYNESELTGLETNLEPVKKSGTTWYKPSGATFTSGVTQGSSTLNTATNTLTWSGLTTFSEFGAAGNQMVALPIEIVYFKGEKSDIGNKLSWQTNSEIQNDFFTIEKTLDGKYFEVLGVVNGAGNSNQTLDYLFIDNNFGNEINYYRLSQTDFDGSVTTTNLVSINNKRDKLEKVVAYETNVLGQEINEFYRGVVIIVYTDGSSIKIIR